MLTLFFILLALNGFSFNTLSNNGNQVLAARNGLVSANPTQDELKSSVEPRLEPQILGSSKQSTNLIQTTGDAEQIEFQIRLNKILHTIELEKHKNVETFKILNKLTQNTNDTINGPSNGDNYAKDGVKILKRLPKYDNKKNDFTAQKYGNSINKIETDRQGAEHYPVERPGGNIITADGIFIFSNTGHSTWQFPSTMPYYTTLTPIATTKNFMEQMLESKAIYRDGYFSGFLAKLFEIVFRKTDNDVKLLCSFMPLEFATLVNQDKYILSFGRGFVDVLQEFSIKIANTTADYIKHQATILHHAVRDRKHIMTPELVAIIDYIDTLYEDKEGKELFKSLEMINDFSNTTKSPQRVLRSMTGALFAPYIRLAGTYKRQVLIDAINKEIDRVKIKSNANNIEVEKIQRRAVYRNNNTRFHVIGRNANEFKDTAKITHEMPENAITDEIKFYTDVYETKNIPFTKVRSKTMQRRPLPKKVHTDIILETKSVIPNHNNALQHGLYASLPRGATQNMYRKNKNPKEEIQFKTQKKTRVTYNYNKASLIPNNSFKKHDRVNTVTGNLKIKYWTEFPNFHNKELTTDDNIKNGKKRKNNHRAINKIAILSSYSDDEEALKFHLYDAMRHKLYRRGNSLAKHVREIRNKNILNKFSSYSSEEVALKSNVYNGFGFKPPSGRRFN